MNRHWIVHGKAGTWVVRRYHSMHGRASILWEHELIAFVARAGWPVAQALTARDGGTVVDYGSHLWSAFPFLAGEVNVEPGPAGWHEIGRLLARFHGDVAGFSPSQRPLFGQLWEVEPRAVAAGATSFEGLLRELAATHPKLASLIRRERARNLEEVERLAISKLPVLAVHGDFAPWNLLFKNGALSGLLDFDQARVDAPMSDLAKLLMPFQPLPIDCSRTLLAGYQSVHRLLDAEWASIPVLARSALLSWVAFLLVSWRFGGGEPCLEGIVRTMTTRLPAFEAFAPELAMLREGTRS
jgi:Ser/Thr protein kinase RdoA (MazF antagonist)